MAEIVNLSRQRKGRERDEKESFRRNRDRDSSADQSSEQARSPKAKGRRIAHQHKRET